MRTGYRFYLTILLLVTDFALVFLSVYLFLSPSDRAEMYLDWDSFQNGLYISMQAWFIAALYHQLYRNFEKKGFTTLFRISWRVFMTQQILYIAYLNLNPSILKDAALIQQAVFSCTFLIVGLLVSRFLFTLFGQNYERKMKGKHTVAIWGFNQTGIELAARFERNEDDKIFRGILDENHSFDYTKKKELHIRLREAIKLASSQKIRELFIAKLDVDAEVADILIEEGFGSLEEVAYVPLSEMLEIDAFDEDTVNELRTRARDSLLTMEIAKEEDAEEVSQTLESVDGMTADLVVQLASNSITSRDDLAELAVDELVEMTQIDEERAKLLIMTARAHWFN